MKEKTLEIYYDHYKDTFENLKVYIQKRNNFTIAIICLAIALSFQISNPEKTSEISNELLQKNVGDISIDLKYITSALIFALLWTVIMYYQIIFVIEKNYTYLHSIEEKLSSLMAPIEICREGKNYLDHYPWLSFIVDKIYTIVFPLVIILIAVFKWINERKNLADFNNLNFWIDTLVLLGIVIVSLLYLSFRHFNDFKKKKPCS